VKLKLYTLSELAKLENIRPSTLTALIERGDGPEPTPIGARICVTEEARVAWHERMANERWLEVAA
jgi:hypothetical protein